MGGFRYTIHFEADESDVKAGRIWMLARATNADLEFSHPIYSEAFSVEDLKDVLLAMPWIREDDDQLCLRNDVWHHHLAEVVDNVLSYFHAPNEPNSELLEVKEAVGEYYSMQESSIEFPLYAYAWLDVMIREDVADEARSSNDVWRKSKLSVDCESICDRRVEELISYFSKSQMRIVGRMADSVSTQKSEESRNTKTG